VRRGLIEPIAAQALLGLPEQVFKPKRIVMASRLGPLDRQK
jgi:hypothetical protein